jgi:nucleoside-diphosphate-sugar epimerase
VSGEIRVFLTGATGYSGQAVAAELPRRGLRVQVLVRRQVTIPGCETVVGDLRDVRRFASSIRASSSVIHLASPRGETKETVTADVLATRDLIAAWRAGPFIYPSHATVYGIPESRPLKEDHAFNPMLPYDHGKIAIEKDVQAKAFGKGRGPGIVIRPSLIFATNDRRADRQFFSWIYILCRAGKKFVFDSENGLETYGASFIGEDDYGRAIADSIALQTSGAYHVASGFCTWRDLIGAFDRQLGTRSEFVIRAAGQAEASDEIRLGQSRTELDTTSFAAATGFVPRQAMEELVERFAAEERQNPVC